MKYLKVPRSTEKYLEDTTLGQSDEMIFMIIGLNTGVQMWRVLLCNGVFSG